MTPWTAKSEDVIWNRKTEVKVAVTDNDPMNARILKLATDLGNTVLAKKAANDLQTSVPFRFLHMGCTLI
jgi:rapamycin-insensitive companion of mTOR